MTEAEFRRIEHIAVDREYRCRQDEFVDEDRRQLLDGLHPRDITLHGTHHFLPLRGEPHAVVHLLRRVIDIVERDRLTAAGLRADHPESDDLLLLNLSTDCEQAIREMDAGSATFYCLRCNLFVNDPTIRWYGNDYSDSDG